MKLTTRNFTAATLAAGLGALSASPVFAQSRASFPDVPTNHWAYQAVQDLAAKGYVHGYPDGKFLGKRALTRYEFATVIDRIAQTLADLAASAKPGQTVETPIGAPVTQDDLNKVNALVDSFQTQLAAIQSTTAGAKSPFQGQIDSLRADVTAAQKTADKAQNTADNSYGIGAGRKFQISGYLQTRYTAAGNSETNFPQGSPAKNGGYNGNYSQGGNSDSFEVRRARLKFTGQITPNTKYAAQLDFSGASTTTNQQVTTRDANISYTFGDGSDKFPTLTFGQFATPFGYALPGSNATSITPERPLAFSEASYGLFASQDFDKGAEFTYRLGNIIRAVPLTFTAAFINGNGRTSDEADRRIDQVYHLAYATPSKVVSAGISYYNGQLPGSGTGASYVPRKKQLFGADAQIALPVGLFVNGEYVSGKYEQRTAFDYAAGTGFALSPTTTYAPGNKVEGYYAQGGWTFAQSGPHPLTLFASYDVLRRATSGAGASDSYTDANTGYGVLYNFDKATRLRLYYVKPSKVAHDPSAPEAPQKIGQTIAEVQVKF